MAASLDTGFFGHLSLSTSSKSHPILHVLRLQPSIFCLLNTLNRNQISSRIQLHNGSFSSSSATPASTASHDTAVSVDHASSSAPNQLILEHENSHTTSCDLTTPDAIADWFRDAYSLTHSRRVVLAKVNRAEAALLATNPDRRSLSLQRDIIPKAELLDALSPGLAWKVFTRYPSEFVSPEAEEMWRIMAALLYTTGFSPSSVSTLFKKHISLFARTVQDPSNLKSLFEWLRELGLKQADIMRIINIHPLILQDNVEKTLKPRLDFLINDMKMTRKQAASSIRRFPFLLSVDTTALQERVNYLKNDIKLSEEDVTKLVSAQPDVLMLKTKETLEPSIHFIRTELGCDGPLLHRVITRSGLLTRSPDTIRHRVRILESYGVDALALTAMIRRFPRVLIYPIETRRYIRKIEFLKTILSRSDNNNNNADDGDHNNINSTLVKELVKFPQYLSYNLAQRIAPRMAAATAILGPKAIPPLSPLTKKLPDFLDYYGIGMEEYMAAVQAWKESEEAHQWLIDDDDNTDDE